MATAKYGYAKQLSGPGSPAIVYIGIDGSYTPAPQKGDFVKLDATTRLLLPCAENEAECYGVLDAGGPLTTTDNDYKLPVIIDPMALFRYPVDTGETVAATYRGKTCDIAEQRVVQLAEQNQDIFVIEDVDIANNEVLVRIQDSKRGIIAS